MVKSDKLRIHVSAETASKGDITLNFNLINSNFFPGWGDYCTKPLDLLYWICCLIGSAVKFEFVHLHNTFPINCCC